MQNAVLKQGFIFLVSVSIVGVLSAATIPDVIAAVDKAKSGAAKTELRSVETAVLCAMASQGVARISGGTLDATHPFPVGSTSVAAFTRGVIRGTYAIAADGTVTQIFYP